MTTTCSTFIGSRPMHSCCCGYGGDVVNLLKKKQRKVAWRWMKRYLRLVLHKHVVYIMELLHHLHILLLVHHHYRLRQNLLKENEFLGFWYVLGF
jgi:hypothetical protein